MDNLLKRFSSPVDTRARSFWMQDYPVPSPYPVVNKYVISLPKEQDTHADLEIKAVPVPIVQVPPVQVPPVLVRTGLPSSASSRKQSKIVLNRDSRDGVEANPGQVERSMSHKLMDIQERPRSPSPVNKDRRTGSPLPPIKNSSTTATVVVVPMLPMAHIGQTEGDRHRGMGLEEGRPDELDTERIIDSYRDLAPELVGVWTSTDDVVVGDSPERTRFEDIPITIAVDKPPHMLRDERRLESRLNEFTKNTFNFAPLVDELLKDREGNML